LADDERGFSHRSSTLGTTARDVSDRSAGWWPHTHTGKSGGHVQPRAAPRMKRLTIRSSSEWKLMTTIRPPGVSRSSAASSPSRSDWSSSLVAMRSAWKTRLAGWPWPNRAGVGMAERISSTRSALRSIGRAARRRTMARAIWRSTALAVAPEYLGDLALVPRVHDLGRRERGRRVHAHVERGVVGVAEPAPSRVDLHRRRPEIHQDRVGAGPGRRHVPQHEAEVTADEPGRRGRRRGEALVERRHRRVAVDGHVHPRASEQRLEVGRMAAGAERTVDNGVARARLE
jgi:hypothetical protein